MHKHGYSVVPRVEEMVCSGLFSDVVNTVVDRYQEAKKQSAFRELIPRCFQELAPSTSRSRSGHSDRREEQKASVVPVSPCPHA